MERMLPLLAAVSMFLTAPSWANAAQLRRLSANPKPNATVPVTPLPGNRIGCVIVPTASMRALTGLAKVHAVACVEATTGEVIVAVLHRNGTLSCSGSGYLDPNTTNCATITGCGRTDYYCLF